MHLVAVFSSAILICLWACSSTIISQVSTTNRRQRQNNRIHKITTIPITRKKHGLRKRFTKITTATNTHFWRSHHDAISFFYSVSLILTWLRIDIFLVLLYLMLEIDDTQRRRECVESFSIQKRLR